MSVTSSLRRGAGNDHTLTHTHTRQSEEPTAAAERSRSCCIVSSSDQLMKSGRRAAGEMEADSPDRSLDESAEFSIRCPSGENKRRPSACEADQLGQFATGSMLPIGCVFLFLFANLPINS